MISSQPAALQLRTLQTLVEVSAERNNTIVFPIPIELIPRGGDSRGLLGQAMMPIASAIASNVAAKSKDAEGQPQNEDQRALPPPPPTSVDQGL